VITEHRLYFQNADNLSFLADKSIDLVVTSPPYPMIKMWDKTFSSMNREIKNALIKDNGESALLLMHEQLNHVWDECARVLKPGGIACINIGDAVRKIGESFKLYSNHSLIIKKFMELGFDILPHVLWRKQTNAPNKFMGSGMFPPGAYITLEHEYILVMRKGNKREFKNTEDKKNRHTSAYFWEERNIWFSDVWDFKGVKQTLNSRETRKRSAAFPFELPYRIINMFSVKGDIILDPFCGTGTTALSAIASNRNSVSVDIDNNFKKIILDSVISSKKEFNKIIKKRISDHKDFIEKYSKEKKTPLHRSLNYGFPVITKQEINIRFDIIKDIDIKDDLITVKYIEYK
jgi:modification methylase